MKIIKILTYVIGFLFVLSLLGYCNGLGLLGDTKTAVWLQKQTIKELPVGSSQEHEKAYLRKIETREKGLAKSVKEIEIEITILLILLIIFIPILMLNSNRHK